MGFFEQLSLEISNMDLPNFIVVALLFYVPFYLSKKAQTLFFHLMYSVFGLYMLFTMEDVRIIYDTKMLVGLGLLIPQVSFLRWFIPHSIQTIKMMSSNTYYFFITIYYKIIRFIKWIKSIPSLIIIFLKTFSFKKFNEPRNDYEKYNTNFKNRNEYKKQEKSQEEKQEESYSYNANSNSSNINEELKHEIKKDRGDYERYYSKNAYTVLGVSIDDNRKTIQKAYRKLSNEFHPDKYTDDFDFDFYNEIMGNINSAYSKLKKIHK